MKPEFRIREVTRYVITCHDASGTRALAEVANQDAAQQILDALQASPTNNQVDDSLPVEELGLSHRTTNLLRENGILTAGKLRRASGSALRTIKKVGPKMIEEVEAMQRYLS